jgi:hypothetical protein
MPILGIMASAISGNLNSYESIATTTVGSGGVASITFSSIPATYTHLQLRFFASTNRASPIFRDSYKVQFNSDTAANYSNHELYGDGSSTGAGAGTSTSNIAAGTIGGGGFFGVSVFDVLQYANTNIYKTTRSLSGVNDNTGGYGLIDLRSGNWRSTSAINSITLITGVGTTFVQYTQAALYGIKG